MRPFISPYDPINHNQRTFSEIFSSVDEFTDARITELVPTTLITDDQLKLIYYLLYGKYGDSTIKSSNESQFVFRLFGMIASYAPAMLKRADIQKKLTAMSLEDTSDLFDGGKQIFNHAYNPSTEPSTDSLSELTTIDDQKTSGFKRNKLEAYSHLSELLETDLYEEFINRFKVLFISILATQKPLLYVTEEED